MARDGARRFGGKAREYIAEAMRLAWREKRSLWRKIVDFTVYMKETIMARITQKAVVDRRYPQAGYVYNGSRVARLGFSPLSTVRHPGGNRRRADRGLGNELGHPAEDGYPLHDTGSERDLPGSGNHDRLIRGEG